MAANKDDWSAFGFAHEEAGGRGEFVGDGENGGLQLLAVTVALAAEIAKNWNARSADGDIGEAKTPRAAERIADDNGDSFVRKFCEAGGESLRRFVWVFGKKRDRIAARHV